MSGRLQVRLEGFDRDLQRRIGALAPELAAIEDHRVQPLRILAAAGRRGVREDVASAHRLDDANTATRVTRQARVARRVDGLRAHPIARLEPRLAAGRAKERATG